MALLRGDRPSFHSERKTVLLFLVALLLGSTNKIEPMGYCKQDLRQLVSQDSQQLLQVIRQYYNPKHHLHFEPLSEVREDLADMFFQLFQKMADLQ
jgi:hypothetical protein